MPYIKQEDRPIYDSIVDELAERIRIKGCVAGEVNYVVTRLVATVFKAAGKDGQWSYNQGINAAIGALECAKLELYDRIARGYENLAELRNGDVKEYAEFEAEFSELRDKVWDEIRNKSR